MFLRAARATWPGKPLEDPNPYTGCFSASDSMKLTVEGEFLELMSDLLEKQILAYSRQAIRTDAWTGKLVIFSLYTGGCGE